MRRTVWVLLSTILVLLTVREAAAQALGAQVVEIKLRDGSQIFGHVVSEDPARLTIRTISGADVTVARDQVESIKPTSGQVVGGEFWMDDAVASKLFLGATGHSLRRGQAYVAIDSLFLPVFQVGVTDRFSIGMGAPFYGLLKTAWVTPKFQVYRGRKTAIASGVLHLLAPDFGFGGYGYVVATRGTSNGSVTFGGGMLYGRDDGSGDATPMFTIGGERRVTRRSKFVTENYIFKDGVIATAGARIIGRTASFEFGGILPFLESGGFPGIFFNFVFHDRPRASR